jgi:hypothetical protein
MSFFDHLENMRPSPASESHARLCRMLENGGSATWFDGKRTWVLCHNRAAHRPMQKLPWPLSTMQPHLIELSIYEGDLKGNQEKADQGKSDFQRITDVFAEAQPKAPAKPVHQQMFKKSEMQIAIGVFLHDARPDDAVNINEELF